MVGEIQCSIGRMNLEQHLIHVPTDTNSAGRQHLEDLRSLEGSMCLGAYRSTASFALELTAIAGSAVAAAQKCKAEDLPLAPGDTSRQRALGAVLFGLEESDSIRFEHSIRKSKGGARRYLMRIECRATRSGKGEATARALHLKRSLVSALAAGMQDFCFEDATSEPLDTPTTHTLWLAPHGLSLRNRLPAGMLPMNDGELKAVAHIPLPAAAYQSFSECLLSALPSVGGTCAVRVEFTGRQVHDTELSALASMTHNLLSANPADVRLGCARSGIQLDSDTVAEAEQAMRRWIGQPAGVQMRVFIVAENPIPHSLACLVGEELLQGRSFEVHPASSEPPTAPLGDFSAYLLQGSLLPPVFPDPMIADALGCSRHYPRVQFVSPAEGINLGEAVTPFGVEEVRFSAKDRSQHCYILGSTGTGKSTLMLRMIQQDIEAGSGLALLDPHGDLYSSVLQRIPEHRLNDVVLLDFSHFGETPGLNPLQCAGEYPEIERNFVIRDLGAIFRKLYGTVPESMGPMFFLYMRNAVALAMGDPAGDATLLDIPRLFSDDLFRAYLIRRCTDGAVRDFWNGIAERAGGDLDLKTVAPYIINKFTEFTDNALIRHVVGQPSSSINLRSIMDERKILLVNLSKGLLGESDSKFLGMLLTSRLLTAGMGRANVPVSQRVPFSLYLDEFQNFTADIATTLAEARKYALHLTISHQNIAQIDSDMAQTVLANTGTSIFLRLGSHDASMLAEYVAPHFDALDLNSLPDFSGIARVKMNNAVSPAFLLRTSTMTKTDGVRYALQESVERQSRRQYCRPMALIKHLIESRRYDYILKLSLRELGLSVGFKTNLHPFEIKSVSDIVDLSDEVRVSLQAQAVNSRDHAVMHGISQIVRLRKEAKNFRPTDESNPFDRRPLS
jgi:hypothetical protein